jgi:hypothetical protein
MKNIWGFLCMWGRSKIEVFAYLKDEYGTEYKGGKKHSYPGLARR